MELNNMDDELLDELFGNEIVVYEDVQGSKIYAKWDGEDFLIKSNNLNAEPVNFIDDSIDNYYGKAFNHLNSLNERVKGLLPKRWWFCFQYFPEESTIYSRQPKNNLVLSSIVNKIFFKYFRRRFGICFW